MSENNSGANMQQSDNRSGEQNKDKRQRYDPSKQDGRRNNYNRNRRRRNNGPRQGQFDNKKNDSAEAVQDNKNRGNKPQPSGREQNNNNNNKAKRNDVQGQDKRNNQFGERRPKNRRPREFDNSEVAKNVKKVETIEDIRSDNARITKEIYLEIASLKNINLN